MKNYINPPGSQWAGLCQRPVLPSEDLEETVSLIMERVRQEGDRALKEFTLQFDNACPEQFKVSDQEISQAINQVPEDLKEAIAIAAGNIRAFHISQQSNEQPVETMQGITCWRKPVAIENIGIYIPGGSAPLFSTVLMLAIPAKIAGCKRVVLCSPCDREGKINPAILYTASIMGITDIFKVGGAQAIAALGYGTERIPRADKIFGPGNQYVTKAKELIQKQGVAIDLPAGPSEVLIIADETADADFVAADLLSQAEHGADSQVVLLTNDASLIEKVNSSLQKQLEVLPRAALAAKALENSFSVILDSTDACFDFSNLYAPEHLILAIKDAAFHVNKIQNAGSVFVGKYSCESAGDYASGTNHTLPTNGYARSYSGVSVDSFIKKITFQEITEEGLKKIGKTIETMAAAEQLSAHKNAVTIRLKKINNAN